MSRILQPGRDRSYKWVCGFLATRFQSDFSRRAIMGRKPEALGAEPLVPSERDVVALVAHELKNPLAAIEAALPLMADAPQAASRQKARRVIERQIGYLR